MLGGAEKHERTDAARSRAGDGRRSPFGVADVAGGALTVGLASTDGQVLAAQRLRHQVFVGEFGARLPDALGGVDRDRFDPHCHHLVVTDALGEVVATTRVLTPERAASAGGWYSEGEFDLTPIVGGGARVLEIGRTCVRADHRSGAALSLLWQGLARCFNLGAQDWLMGCASIPLGGAQGDVLAAYRTLAPRYLVEPALRVRPRRALVDEPLARPAPLPPLLLAYLRLGARIGGEPCWDPEFDCADLLVLLDPRRIADRYARHFLRD